MLVLIYYVGYKVDDSLFLHLWLGRTLSIVHSIPPGLTHEVGIEILLRLFYPDLSLVEKVLSLRLPVAKTHVVHI